MQIDWWTLAIQAVNFLVLAWLLNRVLYRPVKAVIDRRQVTSERALKQAEVATKNHEAEQAKLKALQARLEAEREHELSEFHKSLQTERKDVLRKAADEAAETVRQARGDADAERQKILENLKQEIATLAAEMAEKIMSSEGQTFQAASDPRRTETVLKEMPAVKIDRLAKDIRSGPTGIVVVTAAPLSDSGKTEWSAMLERLFGEASQPEFQVDAEILGGVALRFPHSELSLTWAHYLKDAKNALLEASDGA